MYLGEKGLSALDARLSTEEGWHIYIRFDSKTSVATFSTYQHFLWVRVNSIAFVSFLKLLAPWRERSKPRHGYVDGHGSSMMKVTGPSLASSTSIMAPNSPVATGIPWCFSSWTKRSIMARACSGGAARVKLGRRPFSMRLAVRVNWETTRIAPPTSRRDRFIFPRSSLKMRRTGIRRAQCRRRSSVSPCSMQARTRRPGPISPTMR